MKPDHFLTPHTKVVPTPHTKAAKLIKDLKVKPEIMKLLEETGGKLHNIGVDDFWNLTPKAEGSSKLSIQPKSSAQQSKSSTKLKGKFQY